MASMGMRALREFARAAAAPRCELCAGPLPARHEHVLDRRNGALRCACASCGLGVTAKTPWERVARQCRPVPLSLDADTWAALQVPINLPFFWRRGSTGQIVAMFPSPAGATESEVPAYAWAALVARAPSLGDLRADVEALLICRVHLPALSYVVSMDLCFELVGLLRLHWRGFSGGADVWQHLQRFFAELTHA